VEGFSLELDTTGYRYPTSVAFVPEPGPAPGDPLYFVSEMEGAIKVVTNDRSVHTFAEGFFQREFEEPWELPDQRAEFGLGAIALDPVHGYVFASFGYTDEDGSLRNDIIRFSTAPGTFSLKPTASFRFTEAFGNERSSRSHQIGHMIVDSDSLLVAVGNGFNANAGQDLSTVNGKILRMTLDGKPWPDNPLFAAKGGRPAARDYVWAYGLRNPFGLMQSEHGMFAAENGPSVDRLIRIDRGRNYGYDGTDWSMGVNALAVFAPAVGPVQTAWLAPDNDLFPLKYRNAFFIAFGGTPSDPGPGRGGERSVIYLPYDPDHGVVTEPPRAIARYRGWANQMPVGVAFGPDGLYIAPIYPLRDGTSAILRLSYDPQNAHPHHVERSDSPVQLMNKYGCNGCHSSYQGRRAIAPSLDPQELVPRVYERLMSDEYARASAALDELQTEPFKSWTEQRQHIRELEADRKVRRWIQYHLLEPRFDNPAALMSNQGVDPADARRLAEHFVEKGWELETPGFGSLISARYKRFVTERQRWRDVFIFLAIAFAIGVAAGFAVAKRYPSSSP
jgi:glucose/arabinose dehydrogenase